MFKGSMVALVTPMKAGVTPDTPVDVEALERLVEFHIAGGTDALVAVARLPEDNGAGIRRPMEVVAIPVIGDPGARRSGAVGRREPELRRRPAIGGDPGHPAPVWRHTCAPRLARREQQVEHGLDFLQRSHAA